MAGRAQEPVTFEDVAVYLSRSEWETVAEEQRQLYCSVMLDNYELLTSLGYPGPKPDILYRIERGEEPWVCAPQSPVRWDGPNSPSPGHNEDLSSSGWWPEAVGHRVPEERTETTHHGESWSSCLPHHQTLEQRAPGGLQPHPEKVLSHQREVPLPGSPQFLQPHPSLVSHHRVPPGMGVNSSNPLSAGGRCRQWRLRSRRLLNKFRCLKDGTEPPSRAVGRETSPVESQDRTPEIFQPGKEGGTENKREVKADVTQPEGFLLPPVVEQQNKPSDLQERLRGGPHRVVFQRSHSRTQRTSEGMTFLQGNVEPPTHELLEAVLKDHCYCTVRERWFLRFAPCPLQEHDYCRNNEAGDLALQDHEYCHAWRFPDLGGVHRVVPLPGKARVALHRLNEQNSPIERILRTAKRIMWSHKRFSFPQRSSRPEPSAKAEDDSMKGPREVFCPPAKQPRSEGAPRDGPSGALLCAPVAPFEPTASPPPSDPALEVKKEEPHLEVSARRQGQKVEPPRSCDLKENVKGHKRLNPNHVSLHDAYEMVMRTVDYMLDSVCHNLELGAYPPCEEIWPTAIQIDR
ncbi:uncharacterized protein LOC104061115 [Cuculus canorus]|uniref:uncharacterized protein LOC104061115 n=1 Tax=Cuculus canorus TaxID=55661 RepID=UPI0023AA2C6F|nr:uncharacterized protein LOC104061115 [Cuculus canorus]